MELKYVAIMLGIIIIPMVIGMGFSDYQKAEVQKACYEAAKVNTNITCEKK